MIQIWHSTNRVVFCLYVLCSIFCQKMNYHWNSAAEWNSLALPLSASLPVLTEKNKPTNKLDIVLWRSGCATHVPWDRSLSGKTTATFGKLCKRFLNSCTSSTPTSPKWSAFSEKYLSRPMLLNNCQFMGIKAHDLASEEQELTR